MVISFLMLEIIMIFNKFKKEKVWQQEIME
jgi:hypothetical protein